MNYDLVLYLLKASVVLVILTVAYAWLVKRETFLQVNRWLLWINVAVTLLLPIIPMPDFEWMPDAPAKVVAEVIPMVESEPRSNVGEQKISPNKPATSTVPVQVATEAPTLARLSLWDWVGVVYGVVMGLLTLKLLIQLTSIWRLKLGATTYHTDEGVCLVESDKITAPFSFFHWIFYNPSQHSDDEWQQVWAHECIHAHQRHSIDMLMAEVLKIVFWFNPFAWWHQRLVQETLEFITDRAVLDSGVERKSYQYHLLKSTLSANNEAFTNHFNKSLLKNRIAMMNKAKSSWKALGKYGVFIGMLWVCAAFTKPYRAEVAAKIVEQMPELEAVLQHKVAEQPALNDFVWEKQNTTTYLVSKTKYVTYKDSKLYWVVTPKVTLKDIYAIQREFEKVGGVFFVKQMKYDPLGYYLSEISIRTSFLKGGDICATDDLKAIEKPIPAFGGWISISGKSCGIADASYELFFNKLVENDKRDVEKWIREHLIEYFKAFQKAKEEVNEKKNSQLKNFKGRFYTHPFKAPNGFAEFRKDALQYLCETGARNRVYFEGKALRVENIYKSSEFLIEVV